MLKPLLVRFIQQKVGLTNLGPAVKVPGLVFCAGQTATGEIKQATVSYSFFAHHTRPWKELGDIDIIK